MTFFSFGTNDLTQMTFGFSRDDAGKFLDYYYENKIYESDPFAHLDQKGVGKLVKMAAELAQALLQNQWLMEQLKLNKRKLFGTSSEQLDQLVMEQFACLFNEAEAWDADSVEPAKKPEKQKSRKRRSGSIDEVIPEGTPVEVVEQPPDEVG